MSSPDKIAAVTAAIVNLRNLLKGYREASAFTDFNTVEAIDALLDLHFAVIDLTISHEESINAMKIEIAQLKLDLAQSEQRRLKQK